MFWIIVSWTYCVRLNFNNRPFRVVGSNPIWNYRIVFQVDVISTFKIPHISHFGGWSIIGTKVDQSTAWMCMCILWTIMVSFIVFRITPPTYWRLLWRSVEQVTCGVQWKRPQKWKTTWQLWGCVKTDRWDVMLYIKCKLILVERCFHCTEFCLMLHRHITCSGFLTITV